MRPIPADVLRHERRVETLFGLMVSWVPPIGRPGELTGGRQPVLLHSGAYADPRQQHGSQQNRGQDREGPQKPADEKRWELADYEHYAIFASSQLPYRGPTHEHCCHVSSGVNRQS